MAEIKDIDVAMIPYLAKFGKHHYWVDYDEETDTLYISFRKPQSANDSVMEENVIYHYDNKDLVGITVLHAKSYKAA